MGHGSTGQVGPDMPHILTSWKEIGQYLGKGVRTVQRWEREGGLPVRRQTRSAPHAILAISDELDAWARSQTRGPTRVLAEALRREIAILHAENEELRARLGILEAVVANSAIGADSANRRHEPPSSLRLEERFSIDSGPEPPSATGLPGTTRKGSHGIRFAARRGRALAVRARLSFAFTLCSLIENHVRHGDLATLRRAQDSAMAIRRSLDSPGYVPGDELDDLRTLLGQLGLRIERIMAWALPGRQSGSFSRPS